MALKRKLTKAEYDALNAVLKAEYKADGDNFVLDADDATELQRARDREAAEVVRLKAEKVETDRKLAEAEAKLADDATVTARKAGDIKTLEDSWKTKLDKANKDNTEKIDKLTNSLQATLVDGVAQAMAAELAGDGHELLTPIIRMRLTADLSGDKPLTRVLDRDGKPAAMSVEELKNEIKNDKKYATVVIGSRASGSSATGTGKNGGSAAATTEKTFQSLTAQERTDWYNRDKTGFLKASEEDKATRLRRV